MKITLLSSIGLRVENEPGMLSIEASTPGRAFEPFDMLASSLAVCTHAVLSSWAQQSGIDARDLVVEVQWSIDDEHRMNGIDVSFHWPRLPEERLKAAHRAASLCSIHRTLSEPPRITIRGER